MKNALADLGVVLVGASGYGEWYLNVLLDSEEQRRRRFRLLAVVDPYAERSPLIGQLRERRIPVFASLDAFYAAQGERGRCDLAILSSPIHLHCAQACLALRHGSHVLCEKPLCASAEQIALMLEAERASGKTVTVGYQWSFSEAIQRLKADVLAGRFGKAQRLRTLVCWPRGEAYYGRNRWAGRLRAENGEPVLDSPVNNATAHFLHNMLYILGGSPGESAVPERVEASLWRANAIENYDTAALRIRTREGAEILFLTSHAVEARQGPVFSYAFERGVVSYDAQGLRVTAACADGATVDYGSPDDEPARKIWAALDSARTGRAPLCGIASAAAHTRCVLAAQASPAGVRDFPASSVVVVEEEESRLRVVPGLMEEMNRCYEEGRLFEASEHALFEAAGAR